MIEVRGLTGRYVRDDDLLNVAQPPPVPVVREPVGSRLVTVNITYSVVLAYPGLISWIHRPSGAKATGYFSSKETHPEAASDLGGAQQLQSVPGA